MTALRPAKLLAVTATGTAVCLSVLAGWQRGGTLPERVVWVAIGVVLVVSAHLLPTLLRRTPVKVRLMGYLLWGACMVTACYGHATFFTLAQQHAGDVRASAVTDDVTDIAARPTRALTPVMEERATVTRELALAKVRHCSRDCAGLEARRVTLAAKVDALNAEADEIRRQQAGHDRVMAVRDALRADPVTSRLATLFGVSTARVDMLSGLAFAAVLEGVACLFWTVALRSTSLPASVPVVSEAMPTEAPPVANVSVMPQQPVTASHAEEIVSREAVMGRHAAVTGGNPPRDDPVTPLPDVSSDGDVSRLVDDIAAGRVRATVADIRRYLGCSQARASALRRQLVELAPTN
ncbi:hypothetical protein [Paraburkholderia sp. BL9I2N2]|uniref:hypothetical protein n=1 Tax=Paraburkholderia sp. BL9I2N2 TaxID=1938809 RepID=UPI001051DEA8|nr:hypothetical protein [Paraburkholderia sp. BL9I2N2]TCK97128.1 hypothetical protein B0G74_3830 [Paraburkholderia sp. BL9I2N2]